MGARDLREHVAHEVHPAALPAGAGEHGGDGLLQPLVRVGDDQARALEPPGHPSAQERRPEALRLGRPDRQAQAWVVPIRSKE